MFVWIHVLTILGFLAYLPRSKHLHIFVAAINVWFGRTRAGGRLEPLKFDDPDVPEDETPLRGGRSQRPHLEAGARHVLVHRVRPLPGRVPGVRHRQDPLPKLVIMGLRDLVLAQDDETPLVPDAVPADMIWDCVTCGACVQACPVSIEHVDHIVDLRRHLVMVESSFPAESEQMLRDVERASNPWGKAQSERADWAADLGVTVLEPGDPAPEYLYWVGCASSFDERARKTAEATAKLLQSAGLDFAILGPRESCTGDPARRIGNEYVFQAFAEQNVETLNDAGITKIVTGCPHCFNTIANEYPDFGGSYEVVHHSELLSKLVRDGRHQAGQAPATRQITYHDSCYLARHNDVSKRQEKSSPQSGKPIEMQRSRKQTFCCGAGGAHMWMEERAKPINEERVREAAATGASTLAVACPFCTVMLDDGVQSAGADLRVVDVATLLAESIEDAG